MERGPAAPPAECAAPASLEGAGAAPLERQGEALVGLDEVRRALREELLAALGQIRLLVREQARRGRGGAGGDPAAVPEGAAAGAGAPGAAGAAAGAEPPALQAALREVIAAGLVGVRQAVAEELGAEDCADAEPRCPQGHPLRAARAPNDTYVCDRCKAAVPKGTVLWGCRRCNYDECQACCGRESDFPPADKRKLIICVRGDIGMSIGKTAAQVGHAVHSAVRHSAWRDLQAWEACGSKKVTLRVDSQEQLLEIRRAARGAGLIAESIRDAGHTELEPGTMTVLAVGPAQDAQIDALTGHLRPLPDALRRENEKVRAQATKLQTELDSVRKEKKIMRQDKLRLLALLSVKDRYV
ncbi:unnamed protein product [Prorocentrum cordatum]|uniref:peptidyl-tRNA hydrolase n=1 Tax=Prorocentrum cordatum TaxID=2364126 RepID=A0ABN9VSU6_9DINO|nr:unnamed protein product [Polarella glacialis]